MHNLEATIGFGFGLGSMCMTVLNDIATGHYIEAGLISMIATACGYITTRFLKFLFKDKSKGL